MHSSVTQTALETSRLRSLQVLGVVCGFTAGAWLGAAEAPTKLVAIGVSPVVISFIMVLGVFLARWSLPALIQGTSYIRADVRQAPHLMLWAVLAGCLWAVANTLTIFAIRDIGLSIAFPLWNTNSLLGIFWGFLFFNELRQAGWRWLGVLGGALVMFGGATLLAFASSTQAPPGHAMRGVLAALGAGVLWGTMYIPYRKAYLTGMNPLSFITFFTFGELGMMTTLAITYTGGVAPLWRDLVSTREVLFWLLLGGFIWVVGDLFQQYAAKYIGISRGIPLSNTNQLWGLLWGILVFGELHGGTQTVYAQVIGGSLLMALGAGAIALSSATPQEHARWQEAAQRESRRYGIDPAYVRARMGGRELSVTRYRRTWVDWLLVGLATAVFLLFASLARVPQIALDWGWMLGLTLAMLALLFGGGLLLWRTTRFT
ncbi:MAG: EamA family transporter [Acidobacteria bacterium]|nr:EamA family transporter [Acidobacteriota bacterium]